MKKPWNTLKHYFRFAYFTRSRLVLLVLICLGAFIRFYLLSGEYVHSESYVQITGALEILRYSTFSYEYFAPPGPAIMLIPFLLMSKTESMVQMAIALVGVLLIISSYTLMRFVHPDKTAALVFGLLVASNPIFILLSRVLLFESFLLLFFSFALLVTFLWVKQSKIHYMLLLCIMFFILMLVKTPNILMLPIAIISVTVAKGGTDFKKSLKGLLEKNTLIGVLF
ncbi:MAG: glycosyltransferase family 39 protein, partial [Candidatus Hermodarchaeota archaeon]